jgi:hypothetical protein
MKAPDRIWMSNPDDEGEVGVWFDPDEGGNEYVSVERVKALEAENARLKARVDAAEAALEAESDWALAQPNAICDPMQDERVKRLVEAAFYEGFLEGAGDGWVNNPRIKLNWKNSRALAALRDMGGRQCEVTTGYQ